MTRPSLSFTKSIGFGPSRKRDSEIGTSGTVSYGFSQIATLHDIPVIRINPDGDKEPGITLIKEASEISLPRLVSKTRDLVGA